MHHCTLKNCPCCDNEKLVPVEYNGQVVDFCRKCRGKWFECGELEGAWKEAHSHLPDGRAVLEDDYSGWGEPLTVNKNALSCPDCGKEMSYHYLSDNYQVELARCQSCNGVWIDEDKRCAVHYAPKVRAAIDEIEKPLGIQHFIFQIISRLPAEFNMKPRSTPWVTRILIAINILVFAIVLLEPSLWAAGGIVPAEFSRGENLYTLITHQFQHGDYWHLLGNMFFLYLAGESIEDLVGRYQFLLIYLLGGVAAAIAQWAIDPHSFIPMIGASGAISGLFGIYILWFRRAKLTFMLIIYQIKVAPWIFFLAWTVVQLIGIYSQMPGIAYSAHLGGFVYGLIVGAAGYKTVLSSNPILGHLNGPYVNIASKSKWVSPRNLRG